MAGLFSKRRKMRLIPAFIDWIPIEVLHGRWAIADAVSSDAVLSRLVLVVIVAGGLAFLWHFGKGLPKASNMERGVSYIGMLVLCGIGAGALHSGFGLDLTWSWVAFLAAGSTSCAGMATGYKAIDDENEAKNPGKPRPPAFKTGAVFLIAAAAAFFIFKGYFLILSLMCR